MDRARLVCMAELGVHGCPPTDGEGVSGFCPAEILFMDDKPENTKGRGSRRRRLPSWGWVKRLGYRRGVSSNHDQVGARGGVGVFTALFPIP